MFATIFNRKDYITPSGTMTFDLIQYKKDKSKVMEPGFEYDYKEQYDKDGNRSLVIVSRHSVYDKIQSFKDDVDIYKILNKYFGGDISVLDKNKGFYADSYSMPKSFNDYHNKIVEGQALFGALPVDFKEKFGNNINTFMTSIYDKTFESKFEEYKKSKSIQPQVQSQVQPQVQPQGKEVA